MPRAHRPVQPGGRGAQPGGGEELDGADPHADGGGIPPAQLARSTRLLSSHTRTPSSKSLAAKRSRSNTVPLLSVTRRSRPRASMRAMSPKRAMNGRPRSI